MQAVRPDDPTVRAELAERLEKLLRRDAIAYLEVEADGTVAVLTAKGDGAFRQVELRTYLNGRPRLVRVTVEVVE